jgi:hypothetical protein
VDGSLIYIGGSDGSVNIINSQTGEVSLKELESRSSVGDKEERVELKENHSYFFLS